MLRKILEEITIQGRSRTMIYVLGPHRAKIVISTYTEKQFYIHGFLWTTGGWNQVHQTPEKTYVQLDDIDEKIKEMEGLLIQFLDGFPGE